MMSREEKVARVLRRDRDGMRSLRRLRRDLQTARDEGDEYTIQSRLMFSSDIPPSYDNIQDADPRSKMLAIVLRVFSIRMMGRMRGRRDLPPIRERRPCEVI